MNYDRDSNVEDNENFFHRLEYKTGFPKDIQAGNCFKTTARCSLQDEIKWTKGRKDCGLAQPDWCETDLVCVKDLVGKLILKSKDDTNCAGEYYATLDNSYSKHFNTFAAPLREIIERIRYKSKGKVNWNNNSPILSVNKKTGRRKLVENYWKR